MNWINDAGHGGRDPGAVAKGNIEKEYTLEAALYVNKRLLEHGITSECTRYKDETLEENTRVAKVKKFKKGMSHHLNAGGGSGIEVIHSIHSDGKFEHLLIEEFRAAGYPVRNRPVYFRCLPNNPKEDFYYMHRRTGNCRVTIIEYDFVDGPQAEKIKDKAYREGMYECVVRAICRDEGVRYKPLNQPTEVTSEGKVSGMKPSWADWQWAEAANIFKKAREKGILTSDKWEKKAACKDLTFDEIEYLNLVLNGRVL